MIISGIGFYMNTVNAAAMSHYDKLNQGFGNSEARNALPEEQKKDALSAIPAAKLELTIKGAEPAVGADKELEEFSTFVGAAQASNSAEKYSEDWMRPVENFAL